MVGAVHLISGRSCVKRMSPMAVAGRVGRAWRAVWPAQGGQTTSWGAGEGPAGRAGRRGRLPGRRRGGGALSGPHAGLGPASTENRLGRRTPLGARLPVEVTAGLPNFGELGRPRSRARARGSGEGWRGGREAPKRRPRLFPTSNWSIGYKLGGVPLWSREEFSWTRVIFGGASWRNLGLGGLICRV